MRFLADMRLREPLLGLLRGCCDRFPDQRFGANPTYTMADIGMAAFSVLAHPGFQGAE